MTAIRGYMTVGCLDGYRPILDELIDALMTSRLYEKSESVELAVLGSPDDQWAVDELIRPFERIRVATPLRRPGRTTSSPRSAACRTCQSWSGAVYYIHTKGVSHPGNQYPAYWRKLMLDTVVAGHVEPGCAEHHDAVGTNWRDNHYSGNFWWATSEHVRRLPSIRGLRSRPRVHFQDPGLNLRLQCSCGSGCGAAGSRTSGHASSTCTGRSDQRPGGRGDQRPARLHRRGPLPGGRELMVSPYWTGSRRRARTSISRLEQVADVAAPAIRDGVPYDVVLVGWHEAGHCLDVIEWSLDRLAPFGAIVVHDTNPPTAWHQLLPGEFQPGSDWNGEAWQAVVRFRQRHPAVDVERMDTDWGCTVIRADAAAGDRLEADLGRGTWEVLGGAGPACSISCRSSASDVISLDPARHGDRAVHEPDAGAQRHDLVPGLERYLEVGVGNRENFEAIIAPVRQGVDPDGSQPSP